MPSASPGTSVKKPDPNIKSMYAVLGEDFSPRAKGFTIIVVGALVGIRNTGLLSSSKAVASQQGLVMFT